jgi:hypothetical protein
LWKKDFSVALYQHRDPHHQRREGRYHVYKEDEMDQQPMRTNEEGREGGGSKISPARTGLSHLNEQSVHWGRRGGSTARRCQGHCTGAKDFSAIVLVEFALFLAILIRQRDVTIAFDQEEVGLPEEGEELEAQCESHLPAPMVKEEEPSAETSET